MRGLRCRLAVPKPVFLLFTTQLTQNPRAFPSVSGTGWKEERVGPESDPEAEVFLAVECWEAAAAATTAGEAAL